jgi:maltose alpha-D-glucosyltransferase/alpha-amylase
MLTLTFSLEWRQLPEDASVIEQLEQFVLPAYMKNMRWFGGKARKLTSICVDKSLKLEDSERIFHLLIIKAKYRTGKSEDYFAAYCDCE